jgi:hypothetical protein
VGRLQVVSAGQKTAFSGNLVHAAWWMIRLKLNSLEIVFAISALCPAQTPHRMCGLLKTKRYYHECPCRNKKISSPGRRISLPKLLMARRFLLVSPMGRVKRSTVEHIKANFFAATASQRLYDVINSEFVTVNQVERRSQKPHHHRRKSGGGRYRIRTYDFHRVKMALYR